MNSRRAAALLIFLVFGVTCHPSQQLTAGARLARYIANHDEEGVRNNGLDRVQKSTALTARSSPIHLFKKGIILKQLLPFIFAAFVNGIFSVMFNWFFPWKVIPPFPGRVGLGQLFGGFLPKHGVPAGFDYIAHATPPFYGHR